MTLDIKIASINTGGIKSAERRQILFNFCRDGNFDVVGLQEVAFHSCPIIESCYHFLSNVGPNKNGTAFLVKHGLDHSRLLLDPDGRLMSIDLNSFTVINIYAPSGKQAKEERNNFLRRTIPAYASTTRLPLVLIGDFNCVDDIQDRKQTKSQSCPSKIINLALKEMIEGLELIDIWKKLKKTEPGHTFHHHGGSSRLDRIYASKAFADNFRSICLQHLSISDHQSIQSSFTCNLNIPHLAKSTVGLWKMNVLILLEEGFQRTVIDFIEQCSSHPLRLSNVANWWESVLKPGIRRIAIAYCKQRAKRIRETKLFYQSCMQEMSQADTFDWVAFQELRNYSKSWEESTLKGFGVRSRCFEGEENEDATIFHVSRARENFRRCRIEKIIAPNGECLTTKEDVSREIVSHFTSIFKSQSSPDMLAGTGFLEGVKDCCKVYPNLTVPISSLEIKSALIQTKKNKSPGTDGIPYEFYLAFWDEIAHHFLDMFNHILERGTLTSSQGQAAIRLIPKCQDACGVSDFRPISLLNCDYKIMASVLARRLRHTLPDTIGPHQKGGVPGRLIFDNLCLYRDVIQYVDDRGCHDSSQPSVQGMGNAIVGVDFEKAYDLVNRDVLWRIMEVMGYPSTFVRWLQTMYSIAGISILNGTEVAGEIHDIQSIRQGCPISMHLFVLYIEPLLVRLSHGNSRVLDFLIKNLLSEP
jgi:exonuclease III